MHRRLDIVVAQKVEHLILGGTQSTGGVTGLRHQLSVGDFVGQPLSWTSLLFAVGADVVVEQDPIQPTTEVGAVVESVETSERFRSGLLQEILSFGVIVGQLQSVAVKAVE